MNTTILIVLDTANKQQMTSANKVKVLSFECFSLDQWQKKILANRK